MSRKTKVAGALDRHSPKGDGCSSSKASQRREQEAPATLVPELRFPEFRGDGEWKRKPLRKLCRINPPAKSFPKEFVYIDLDSVKGGTLVAKEKISKAGAPSRAQRLLEYGDVIYQLVRPYQKNNLYFNILDGNQYVASTGYAQLRASGNKQFLYQLVHANSFVKRVLANCTGSSYPAINSSDLGNIEIEFPPSLPEQQKIADCLGSLDELIAAHQRKLSALQDHKKGLLQQLFPAEGQTTPKLRFPGFKGEWESESIGTACKSFSGGTPSSTNKTYYGGKIPFIRSAEIGKKETALFLTKEGLTKSAAKMVNIGDVLVALYGANSGDVALSRIEGAINQAILCIRSSGNNAFLCYYLTLKKGWILRTFLQGGQGNLSGEIIKSVQLGFPEPPEQQKIADCLSALDALVTAQTEQIAALQDYKKGLMQKLFPNPELSEA